MASKTQTRGHSIGLMYTDKQYHEVFAAVAPFARRKFDGREFMLSHFPYHGDHTETERYSSCRLRDIGLPLVHGHTHSPFKVQESYPRQLNVAWEAWEEFVTLETVGAWLRTL